MTRQIATPEPFYVRLGDAFVIMSATLLSLASGAWLIARARGEKKPLSMGCMMGQCEHQEHASTEQTGLKEQVSQLEREVQTLRAQAKSPNEGGVLPS